MGIISSNKGISTNQIDCDGSLRVTLDLTAAPDIVSHPTDIVLVLDRSGSMTGTPLANMKTGARTFLDILDEATDGEKDGQIGSGSRIGVVSFADTALANTQLITSVDTLKNAVNALVADGSTNHADAFAKAIQLFDPASGNARVIVLFTDGNTTVGGPPAPIAAAAKAQGIVIYTIGLVGRDGLDVDALNEWASDPDATHAVVTPNEGDLEALFAGLAANITKTGATNVVIHEIVNQDFVITSVSTPSKGSATMLSATELRWNIPELGVTASESATLAFTIQDVSKTPGEKLVNRLITYTDTEGNVVNFPAPTVTVSCDAVVYTQECPVAVDLAADGCSDFIEVDLGDTYLESLGRIIQMDVTIKNVCPGKRTALGVILTEVDEQGNEYQRGVKTMTIPAHTRSTCQDVQVKCIKFVVPEDLDVSGGPSGAVCNQRSFKARVIANYIDTDYRCCESVLTL